MTATRINKPIQPMTLGNMRDNGVRSLDVSCRQCHHRAILSARPVVRLGEAEEEAHRLITLQMSAADAVSVHFF